MVHKHCSQQFPFLGNYEFFITSGGRPTSGKETVINVSKFRDVYQIKGINYRKQCRKSNLKRTIHSVMAAGRSLHLSVISEY